MSQLALYLFGSPRLELDGIPIHIPRRKATALLAYLAATGQSHSRDSLVALLWPENDQSSARAELRRTLSVLNRTLGEGWLVTNRETAGLKSHNDRSTGSSFWLDVAAFQEKLKICESHNHPPTVTCPGCLPALEEAVELYQDDFIAGFSLKGCQEYDEWQFFQSEKLCTRLTSTLVRLSSHYAASLDYETAITYARRWLALDPLQEAAHRQLMSLFLQSGQRTAALHQYEKCRQTLVNELGVEPSEETWELYQRIQASTLLSASDMRPKSNLPAQTTPFIGRESELAEIRAKLREENCRLLTLLGPGGSGKTRLAIEATATLLDDYKHGVTFVNLAPLKDPAHIITTIAAALSFSFYEEGTPEEQLLDYLGNKQLLLILDNFEHLLAGVSFVNQIMNEAPGVKILATSRTSLDVSSEHIFDVWGMVYPESLAVVMTTIEQYSAIKLFESAAKRRQASFELSDKNIPDVIGICDLVEGMPLGIILAANWAKMLSPKEIAAEIARDLTFLDKELQDLPERQWGMWGVFNHSWRMLSDREQRTLAALSVFHGGFTREAAQVVTGASLGDLMGLIDKSILHRTAEGRFDIHELLRQFAAEKLGNESNFETTVRDQHSDYYCKALVIWQKDLEGPQQGVAMQEMTAEIDNTRSAWAWAVERANTNISMSALLSFCYFYHRQNLFLEGQKVCKIVLDQFTIRQTFTKQSTLSIDNNRSQIETLKLLIMALIWDGFFNQVLGNVDLARSLLQESLVQIKNAELPERDKDMLTAGAKNSLSFVIRPEARDESIRLQEESLELFRSLRLNYHVGYVLENLGVSAATREERARFFEESLAVRKKQGDLQGIADSLVSLSVEAAGMCKFLHAEGMANEAITIYKDISYRHGVIYAQRSLGFYYLLQGKFQQARAIQQQTLSLYSDLESTPNWALAFTIAGYADLYMGNYKVASKQALHSLSLCSGKGHLWYVAGTAHATSILGKVALAEGCYVEAQRWFQESIPLFQKLYYALTPTELNNLGQELACLGYTARGMKLTLDARSYFFEALHTAIDIEGLLALINLLPGIALLFADQMAVERATELYGLASTLGMVANSKWFADIAGDEIAAVAERLPAEVAKAAKVRGRGLDLWETAADLLVALEALGWGNANQQLDLTTPEPETT